MNKEEKEMKTWIEGNKGEITLNTETLGERNDDNDEDGLEVAPMDNPLQRPPSSRGISLNI